jgi:prephenate dehydratase
MSKIIGISGAIGSFSEEATNYYCNKYKTILDYKIEYLISVENVLDALEKEQIDYGIFPIENSNGGIVIESVYAMSKHLFNIDKMFEIDVRHCLIAKPDMKMENITLIASHDQALKQCKMYLKRIWPNIEIKEWQDTADSVRALRDGELPPNTAVIASGRAAKIYGMEILEEGIQDLKFNFTTFLLVSKFK